MKKDSRLLSVREVAAAAIRDAGRPLGSKEILEFARRNGYAYMLKGETPHHSIQGILWRDINQKAAQSPFVMVGTGRRSRKYYLRDKFLK